MRDASFTEKLQKQFSGVLLRLAWFILPAGLYFRYVHHQIGREKLLAFQCQECEAWHSTEQSKGVMLDFSFEPKGCIVISASMMYEQAKIPKRYVLRKHKAAAVDSEAERQRSLLLKANPK